MESVYHYTSIESFQKMIEGISRHEENYYLTFWATSIYAMNDPMEFVHGYTLLKNFVLPDIEEDLCITENAFKLSHMWNIIEREITPKDGKDYLISRIYDNHECPFIIAFSKKKDFLPMWNAYSDRGKGVCLCFNNEEYVVKTDDSANIDVVILHKLHAMDVTYGKIGDDVKNVATRLYKKYYLKYKDVSDLQQRTQIMLNYLVALIVSFSAYIKNEAYQYEQEVRLVKYKDDEKDVHYRIGMNGQLKPYIEVKVNLKYLEKVIVGPCADSESVIRELKNQLRCYGIKDITQSNVPYREI